MSNAERRMESTFRHGRKSKNKVPKDMMSKDEDAQELKSNSGPRLAYENDSRRKTKKIKIRSVHSSHFRLRAPWASNPKTPKAATTRKSYIIGSPRLSNLTI